MEALLYWKLDDVAPYLPFTGYLTYAALGIGYFLVQHAILHVIIKLVYPKYASLPSRNLHDYRMQVNAILHALVASCLSFYCLFLSCPLGQNFVNDEECRMVVRNCHVWTCFFTAGYLFVETGFILIFVGCQSTLDK